MTYIKGTIDKDLKKTSFDKLIKKFQKCHDEIWEGGKRDPASSFDEFSKLLITKIYDERFTPAGKEYKFQVKDGELYKEVSDKIKLLYQQVKEKNPKVFAVDINLSDRIIYEIVQLIQDVSLKSTDLDIKGRAFEKFLGKVFRDKYGQYFTPRNAVSLMIEILNPDENDLIIDPACGSGGFLLYSLTHVLNTISERYKEDKESIKSIGWDFAHKQIFGIEINDRIARIAMMDMIIHDDGHSNIECNNALSDYNEFDKRKDIQPNRYSLAFTNPPFGSIIRDKKILDAFTLGKNRSNQKTEILFIERCLDLLKENGKLAIVLPDSILKNSTLQYVRDYILDNSRILAVISLPQHAFVPSGASVKSSLLFLEKTRKKREDYNIFMASTKHIGFDSLGKKDTNELPEILDDWRKYKSGTNKLRNAFLVTKSSLIYNFSPDQFVIYSNNKNWETKKLSELCDGIFTGRTPPRDKYTKHGYKILKVRDLTGKGIDWDRYERGFVSDKHFKKTSHMQIKENDILFITAAHHPKYIGQKIDIVDSIPDRYKEGVVCSAELMVIRANQDYIDPYYILLFLKTKDGYNAIQSCIRGQTAHIYPKDIKDIKIPIPPKEKFEKMVNEIEKMKKSLSKKIRANEEYIESYNKLVKLMESTD